MIAFDTNVLIYAESRGDELGRDRAARELLQQFSAGGGMIPLQVFGEFLNVCRSKNVIALDLAITRIEEAMGVFETPTTTAADLIAASALLDGYNLQFFDALILAVSIQAGATLLLSEDMHDGLKVESLRIVNPFNPKNHATVADYLD